MLPPVIARLTVAVDTLASLATSTMVGCFSLIAFPPDCPDGCAAFPGFSVSSCIIIARPSVDFNRKM
jgi:hypothetical protein